MDKITKQTTGEHEEGQYNNKIIRHLTGDLNSLVITFLVIVLSRCMIECSQLKNLETLGDFKLTFVLQAYGKKFLFQAPK